MKTCSVCEVEKELGEFQRRRASFDGLTAACKSCLHARDKARYPGERDYRISQHKLYVQTPEGKAAHKAAAEKWNQENAVARAAQVILGNAVKNGKVKPMPCEICGKKAHGHHEDYSKPLDVIWLCPMHHKQRHEGCT